MRTASELAEDIIVDAICAALCVAVPVALALIDAALWLKRAAGWALCAMSWWLIPDLCPRDWTAGEDGEDYL